MSRPNVRFLPLRLRTAGVLLGALGCAGESPPPEPPAPAVLQAISPPDVALNAAPFTLIASGTGFLTGATIQLDGADRPTTRVSATTLTTPIAANDLSVGREFAVRVRSADGTMTSPLPLTVRYPVPVLDSLRVSIIARGTTDDLILRGKNFTSRSVARFAGSDRQTVFSDSTALRLVLRAGDVGLAGQYDITVVNGAPGGGTTAARTVTVRNPVPTASGLAPATVASGGAGFALSVTGLDFAPGATVTWNGSDRVTTVGSNGELIAAITAADVAFATAAQVRVRNVSPGGGVSAPLLFMIGTSTRVDSATAIATANKQTSFLVSDVAQGLVYAAAPGEVVAYNGATGTVAFTVPVSGDPIRLALSDDGTYLYANFAVSPMVQRIALRNRVVDLTFDLGMDPTFNTMPLSASDIAVVPGAPRSVVITRSNANISPGARGVGVYDDGVLRGTVALPTTPLGSNRITASSNSLLFYGFDNATTERVVRRYTLTLTGLELSGSWSGLVDSGNRNDIIYGLGRLFTTEGSVSLVDAGVREGMLPAGWVCVDPPAGRVYVIKPDGGITAFNPVNRAIIGSIPTPSGVNHLVRWGVDGFAYRTNTTVVFFRSNLVR